MHSDTANISSVCSRDVGASPPGRPLGSSFTHVARAALNDGEDVLIPELRPS
jgi:hypothetical protein